MLWYQNVKTLPKELIHTRFDPPRKYAGRWGAIRLHDGKLFDMIVGNIYNVQEDTPEVLKQGLWQHINTAVSNMPRRAAKAIAGDFNGDIGPRHPQDTLIGKAYPHYDEGSNSQHLIAFMSANRFKAPHTFHPTVVGTCEGWHGQTFWGTGTPRPDHILLTEELRVHRSSVEIARGYLLKPGEGLEMRDHVPIGCSFQYLACFSVREREPVTKWQAKRMRLACDDIVFRTEFMKETDEWVEHNASHVIELSAQDDPGPAWEYMHDGLYDIARKHFVAPLSSIDKVGFHKLPLTSWSREKHTEYLHYRTRDVCIVSLLTKASHDSLPELSFVHGEMLSLPSTCTNKSLPLVIKIKNANEKKWLRVLVKQLSFGTIRKFGTKAGS